MDIVMVKCFDMCSSSGSWKRKELADFGLVELEVVGWLVEDKKDCIVIAQEYYPEEDQFRHITAIPKVCIKEITNIAGDKATLLQKVRTGKIKI